MVKRWIARYKHHKALWLFRHCFFGVRTVQAAAISVGISDTTVRKGRHAAYREIVALQRFERIRKERWHV